MSLEQWESLPTDAPAWGQWSSERHMMAIIADRLALIQWTLVAVNSEKGKAPKAPEPMSRPGVGSGPPGAVAEIERRAALMGVAILKAREALHGAEPTDAQIESMLDRLTGGDDV